MTVNNFKKYIPIGNGNRAYFLDEENRAVLAFSPQYAQTVYGSVKPSVKKAL